MEQFEFHFSAFQEVGTGSVDPRRKLSKNPQNNYITNWFPIRPLDGVNSVAYLPARYNKNRILYFLF